jgi:hypothetical protein
MLDFRTACGATPWLRDRAYAFNVVGVTTLRRRYIGSASEEA